MKKNNGSFYQEILIRFFDCDKNKRAKIETLMKYMADIAGIAYSNSCMNHADLWENGFVFLLSKVSVHINRMPMYNEVITIETWENDIKGVQYLRNFAIYDQDENIIVTAHTSWIVVNPYSRTIVKPKDFIGTFSPQPSYNVETLPLSKIKAPESMNSVGTRKIVYSDIDANNHVYNAVYASIACDYIPEVYINKNITDFRIYFKHEAVLNDILDIKTAIENNIVYVIGENKDNTSFEFEVTFEEC